MPASRALKTSDRRESVETSRKVEVEAAICQEGQGVHISPICFSGGFDDVDDEVQYGFVVKCSHMKKSASASFPPSGELFTLARSPAKGPTGMGVKSADDAVDVEVECCDEFCCFSQPSCWARTNAMICDPDPMRETPTRLWVARSATLLSSRRVEPVTIDQRRGVETHDPMME